LSQSCATAAEATANIEGSPMRGVNPAVAFLLLWSALALVMALTAVVSS
jgi:hypothetical protein